MSGILLSDFYSHVRSTPQAFRQPTARFCTVSKFSSSLHHARDNDPGQSQVHHNDRREVGSLPSKLYTLWNWLVLQAVA